MNTTKSPLTPRTFSKRFARRQWRLTLGREQFRFNRKNTFRVFTGRCQS